MSTPTHVRHLQDAYTMGRRAGWNHRMLRADTTRPTAEWCGLLREIRVNPWADGQYPAGSVSELEAAAYAKRWNEGFTIGDHAAQSELGRLSTLRAAA